MEIWRACNKPLKQRESEEASVFQPLVDQGFVYNCEEVYLGKEGMLISPNGNIIINWSYTERDGIFIQIKRTKPYKIMFEYADGNYLLNDDRENLRQSMTELKDDLERLRDEIKSNRRINPYDRMKGIISTALARTAF